MSTALAEAFQRQIAWCDGGGSPFTARVLEAALDDWLAGGALKQILPDWPRDPWRDAVALRVAGALHSVALERLDPALAALYPPLGNGFDPATGPRLIRNALHVHRDRVADYLRRPPQTNEVGRSGVLLGGFAHIAARTGRPLALREIGASAGLNLLWHRYRYELGACTWGDAASPVLVRCEWQGAAPSLPPAIEVDSWRGCDLDPVDVAAAGAATRLASYVWPDQQERLQRLRAAVALAQALGVQVERADAAAFLRRELGTPHAGVTTVVCHSIVWLYLDAATRRAIETSIEDAGRRATADAPLAWLALEMPGAETLPQLVLRSWPGDERIVLAEEVHPHGRFVRWSKDLTGQRAPAP